MTLDHTLLDPAVKDIIRLLTEHGHEAYIVGGAVRDLILGIIPKDYDIATSARPEEVKRIFGRRARIIGRRFRLVHVYGGGHIFEVCTFRREPTQEERSTRMTDDGVMIWDDNQYGTRDQDAVRRDYTVNAIYYNPLAGDRFVDTVHGIDDLQNKVVRMIGDPELRLAEDPVRVLRAVKLVAQYGFHLDPELVKALPVYAPRIELSSRARCFEELLKILAKPFAARTFTVCRHYGLLRYFWPNLEAVWETDEGRFLQALLAERDHRVAGHLFVKSKTLGLATLAFAPLEKALQENHETPFWVSRPGLERVCQDRVRDFFQPFIVPRFLTYRVREVLLLLPQFQEPEPVRGVVHHPQYRYAYELYTLICQVRNWPMAWQAVWPVPEENSAPHHRGARQDRRASRRPFRPRPE